MQPSRLPELEVQRVFLRCLLKKGWSSLDRSKVRRLNKQFQQLLDSFLQCVVLRREVDVLQRFPNLETLVFQAGAKLPYQQVVAQLQHFQSLKEIEFKSIHEYIDFAHVILANNSNQSQQKLQKIVIKTHILQNAFIKPCLELGKLVDLNVKIFCHHEKIDFSAFSTGWGMDMLADELEAQNVVFRELEIPNEVQTSLDQDYVVKNRSSFLSARFLIRNFMILPFLELFVVGNEQLQFLAVYLVGTSVLSPELFQVLDQVKRLSVKIGTIQNSQAVKKLSNVVNLELGALIYQQEFPKMENIKSLTISSMFKSSLGFEKDLKLISKFSSLTKIAIGSNAKIDLNDVLTYLSSLKWLKILNLKFFLIRILSFQKLLNFADLEKFSANSIVMQEGWTVSDLERLTNLREIHLSFYEIKNKSQKKQRGGTDEIYSYLSTNLDYFSQVISVDSIQREVQNNVLQIHPLVQLQLFPQTRNRLQQFACLFEEALLRNPQEQFL